MTDRELLVIVAAIIGAGRLAGDHSLPDMESTIDVAQELLEGVNKRFEGDRLRDLLDT